MEEKNDRTEFNLQTQNKIKYYDTKNSECSITRVC